MIPSKNFLFQSFAVLYWIIEFINAEEPKIVNGTLASIEEFPYMISLRHARSGSHMCGGSLLNSRWVLTAAHCVVKLKATQMNIQYGSAIISPNSTKLAKISGVYPHKGYNPSNQYIHDIALLRLKENLILNDDDSNLRGVYLPIFNATTPSQTPVRLMGWGLNETGGRVQEHLQKVDLQVFDDNECAVRHLRPIHSTTICAGVPEGGKGQCNGDSGGPLIAGRYQVGIVSWSRKPCAIAPHPGVFTEVSAYVYWILNTINEVEQQMNKDAGTPIYNGNLQILFKKTAINFLK